MYPRILSRKNKNGVKREYVYLVESVRVGKKVIQKNLGTLGRLDALLEGDTLVNVLDKLVKLRPEWREKIAVLEMSRDLRRESAKTYGPLVVYRQIWNELGFGKLFDRHFSGKKPQFSISEAIFALVCQRLCEPSSKRKASEWIKTTYEPKWQGLELQHLYRAMDYLIEDKKEFEVELFKNTTEILKQKLDVVLMDTTSLSHWGDGEHSTLLKYGYAKNKRGDLRQIVVGVLMTKEGIPIAHEVFEGNQVDVKNFPKMVDQLKTKYTIDDVAVVADKGMMSPNNMMDLHLKGYKFIVGVRLRGRSPKWLNPLLEKEGFAPVIRTEKKKLDVKDLIRTETIGFDRDKKGKPQQSKELNLRYVVCFNPIVAEHRKKQRAFFKEILEKKIPYSSVKSWFKQSGLRKFVTIKGDNIQLAVDYDRLKEEEKFDGLWAVATNWFDVPSREIVSHYKGLRQIEDGFKALKSDLELGPMYHWVSPRIKAHVFICFLALLLQTTLKKKLRAAFPDQSTADLIKELFSVDVSCLHLKDKLVWLRSDISVQNLLTLNALHCQIPKKIL